MGIKQKLSKLRSSVEDEEPEQEDEEDGPQQSEKSLKQRLKERSSDRVKRAKEKAKDPETRKEAVKALKKVAEGQQAETEPNDITGGRSGSTKDMMRRAEQTATAGPPVDASLRPVDRLGNLEALARGEGMGASRRGGRNGGRERRGGMGFGGLGEVDGDLATLDVGKESEGDGMAPDEMAMGFVMDDGDGRGRGQPGDSEELGVGFGMMDYDIGGFGYFESENDRDEDRERGEMDGYF